MLRWLGCMLLLSGIAASGGCGRTEEAKAYDPGDYQGRVDTSLPRPLQDKQAALARFLNGMREGVGDEGTLRLVVPGVTFREPFDKFYGGSKRLARWEFGAKPNGNEVPVVLFFDDVENGPIDPTVLKREERVYVVTGGGTSVSIQRK